MSCLPFVRQLFKFGRKISNMALKIKTTNYNALNSQKNSYYFPAFLDSEIENNLAGSYSSGFISPRSSEASFDQFEDGSSKLGKENDLSSCFDSFNLDEKSFPTESTKHWKVPKNSFDWEQSVNALFDPSSKQFIDFENFVQSSHGFSDCSLFSYSPLSSLESISNGQNLDNDLYSNDLSSQMQQECIRREFEMNGKSIDEEHPVVEETFHPLAMSTPFVERKFEPYKFNYSSNNNNDPMKVQAEQTQFPLPKKHQMSALSVPFQPYNKINGNIDMVQFDSIYHPSYLIQSVSLDKTSADNKIQGRKRGHQTQSQGVLQNQLSMINTNNPSHKFGTSNNKKAEKKNNSSKKKKLDDHCVFCKNNGADEILYRSHTVKDLKGRVLCPKLRAYQCPICGADGDQSHTVKYCPKKPIITMEDLKKLEASKMTGYASSHRF